MATDASLPPRADAPGRTGEADALGDDALGDAAVELTCTLVATDSVNPGLVPGAAGEAEVVALLRERLDAAQFATHVVTPPGHPDRPSLVAIGPAGPPGPTVVLTGHLDTVGVDGVPDPFSPLVTDARITGRGSCDMKAGIAGMVVAAEELARRGTPGQVVLALAADEEDLSLGTEAIIEALPHLGIRPDVAIVGEPTWLSQARTLRGFSLVEVTLDGRAAHSSRPAEGVNAVLHLGRFLATVEQRGHVVAATGGSFMVTVASGGESPFVLAQGARAIVERRTVPGESAAAALDEVIEILDAMRADDPTVTAGARLLVDRDAWRLDDTGPAATMAEALADALGDDAPPEPFHAPYWMEAALWQAANVPALVCGPAGDGLHAADEWVDVRQVRRYAAALTTAVGTWAADHAD